MQILSAWKTSLQSLRWENIKQLFSNILTSLPRIYGNWFIYGAPVIGLIAAISYIYVNFLHGTPYSELLFVGAMSLLSSYLVMSLYIITSAVLHNQRVSFAHYKKHLAIGMLVLMPLFFMVSQRTFYSLLEMISHNDVFFSKKIETLLKEGKEVPPLLYKMLERNTNRDIFLLILFIFSIILSAFINLSSYILLFFLDTKGSLKNFLNSIGKAIKFIFLNIPFLIVLYGGILGLLLLIGRLIHTAILLENNFYGPLFVSVIEPIILAPIFVAIAGAIYKQYQERTIFDNK